MKLSNALMKAQWLSNSWWKTHHLLVWEIHPVECLPKKIQQLAFESNMYPKIMKATCTDCVQIMLSLSLVVCMSHSNFKHHQIQKMCSALNNLYSSPIDGRRNCKGLLARFKHKQSLNKCMVDFNLFCHIYFYKWVNKV